MKWIIKYSGVKKESYYDMWTGIGPSFGANEKTAKRFESKIEALYVMQKMPSVAAVMCDLVAVKE